jgi:glutamate 5-kinase
MAAKIKAAGQVAVRGVPAIIANGRRKGILERIFSGREEGTLFLPLDAPICSRKHWIAFTRSQRGAIVIDRGAERALRERGKSLLPSGITAVKGKFSLGDSVVLINENQETLAVGMVNYHSGDIKKIMGLKSREIESVLGFKHEDEIIHRDNLVITLDMGEGAEECQLKI